MTKCRMRAQNGKSRDFDWAVQAHLWDRALFGPMLQVEAEGAIVQRDKAACRMVPQLQGPLQQL